MVAQATLDGVAAFGTVVAGCLMASQLPAMAAIVMKRPGADINKLSPAPTIGQAANFGVWSAYALVFGDMNLGRVNFIGCGFSLLYFGLFAALTTGDARARFLRLFAAFVVVVGGGIAGIVAPPLGHDTKVQLLGYFATGCNVVMYVGPLDACRMSLKEMDASRIPALLTLSGLACSCTWCAYGLMTGNWCVARGGGRGRGVAVWRVVVVVEAARRGGGGGQGLCHAAGEARALPLELLWAGGTRPLPCHPDGPHGPAPPSLPSPPPSPPTPGPSPLSSPLPPPCRFVAGPNVAGAFLSVMQLCIAAYVTLRTRGAGGKAAAGEDGDSASAGLLGAADGGSVREGGVDDAALLA